MAKYNLPKTGTRLCTQDRQDITTQAGDYIIVAQYSIGYNLPKHSV